MWRGFGGPLLPAAEKTDEKQGEAEKQGGGQGREEGGHLKRAEANRSL
jgi:hypothetical protein